MRTAVLTSLFVAILLAFLAPLAYSVLTSLKTQEQMSQRTRRSCPPTPRTFEWKGKEYDVYFVPMPDGTTQELALVESPAADRASSSTRPIPMRWPIIWEGSWRALEQPWAVAPHLDNYTEVWDLIDFPKHLGNTLLTLAIVWTIGTVISCTLVAYGFARFRSPVAGCCSRSSCRPSSCPPR